MIGFFELGALPQRPAKGLSDRSGNCNSRSKLLLCNSDAPPAFIRHRRRQAPVPLKTFGPWQALFDHPPPSANKQLPADPMPAGSRPFTCSASPFPARAVQDSRPLRPKNPGLRHRISQSCRAGIRAPSARRMRFTCAKRGAISSAYEVVVFVTERFVVLKEIVVAVLAPE